MICYFYFVLLPLGWDEVIVMYVLVFSVLLC